MHTRLLLLARVLGLSALCLPSVAMAVDMTGRWRLDSFYLGSLLTTFDVDLVQNGTTVVGEIVPADGTLEYTGFSAPDSTSGAFQLSGPPSCGPSQLVGTVAPDGQTLSGVGDVFVAPIPGECGEIRLDVTGVRIGQVTPVCGNGVIEVPEQCDDGAQNGVPGDGCGADCHREPITPVCGNGHIETGEQCDDGNTADGDCCSSTCQFEPRTSPCADDGDLCTADRCTGTGSCQHVATPDPACLVPTLPGKARLSIKTPPGDVSSDSINFTWGHGPAVDPADFGSAPSMGSPLFKLCVYDRNGVVRARALASASCGGVPCWKQITGGWRYTSKDTLPDGLTGLLLKGGDAGKAKIKVKGKGIRLALPNLPLAKDPSVTAQLRTSSGKCWGAVFSTDKRNDLRKFDAKSD
jgi:cysteine-rich repeat protein